MNLSRLLNARHSGEMLRRKDRDDFGCVSELCKRRLVYGFCRNFSAISSTGLLAGSLVGIRSPNLDEGGLVSLGDSKRESR